MKRKWIIAVAILVAMIAGYFIFWGGSGKKGPSLTAEVKEGPFEVNVTTTGELRAKHSVKIMGPSGLRTAGIWRVKITDLVPEGTVVEKGEYIASLDRTEVSSKLKELATELEKVRSQYLQTKLDTALTLRKARDELVNLQFAKEEREIELKQSRFEPPATQRQAKINLEKAKRAYEQALRNYQIKIRQSEAKMQEVEATLTQRRNKYTGLKNLLTKFKIKAPKPGMVIYKREWGGKKKTVGASITPWDPVVATLPDLSDMISLTYVNEVDISKVKEGQKAVIQVDAFPGKSFTGQVIDVANVGEELPDRGAKVFKVELELDQTDTLLRPGMSTQNSILTKKVKKALFVPLECVHSNDSVSYVFKEKGAGMVRQEIKTGIANENHIIVRAGLEKNDRVHLTVPEDANDLDFRYLNAQKPGKLKATSAHEN